MLLRRLYEDMLSQASYIIACDETRQAIVVDPNRDVDKYLAVAKADKLTITHVTETHIHAESAESDLRYLAEKVGAGVDFLITQMFFDNDFYFDFVRRARGAGIAVPIIPGIMPITRVGQVERMATMVPGSLLALNSRFSGYMVPTDLPFS
jgi:glyoxylase-like metal-dependent hydrolase (beta-lactamase superfamily II)